MSVADQIQRLIQLGVPELAGRTSQEFAGLAANLEESEDAVVVVHPQLVAASALTPLLARHDKPGFVVVDMADLDEFTDIEALEVPDAPLYLMHASDRGDDLRNWSPDEVYPELVNRGRSPMTISEGISWLLAQPDLLEPNYCFMTIGSRKVKDAKGRLDARTPAIWISGGTGRDGKANRDAPKVGWCWAGNRHTWLGFGSVGSRS
ncbi:MAG: DUF5701 family protein [Actinomycetota bacterium]|nr:DUF5701 family protein [Actinomycetota bacterium]